MLQFNFPVIGISVLYETRDDTPTVTFDCDLREKQKLYFVMSHSFDACLLSSVVEHTFVFGLFYGP